MDDLISRALALEVISAVKGITRSQSGKVLCGKMYSQIKDLPSAKATPVVHGRWINDVCSECGQYVYYGDTYNYCPECGAKMDGERRDDDG